MGQPAAKQGDQVFATDIHIVLVPAPPASPIPTPLPHPFAGVFTSGLSRNVNIMGMPAANLNSIAQNTPPHIPILPGVSFTAPPSNQATMITGSATVLINGAMAVRSGDTALTCNDPAPLPAGKVAAVGTVMIGG